MSVPGPGWAVWVVGLPGSGKSALAKGLMRELGAMGHDPVLLQMDQRRREYFPKPTYSAQERESAYEMFAQEAAGLVRHGQIVIMDAAAYRSAFRDRARELIDRFAEVHVQCSLQTAMRREARRPQGLVMAGLYEKALERQRTGCEYPGLGEVIGVDVPFEQSPKAEFVICNEDIPKTETLARTMDWLGAWLRTH